MAHIRGHIIKLSTDYSRAKNYNSTGNFVFYIFRVMNFYEEMRAIMSTDSYEDKFGNDILFLTQNTSLDHKGKGITNAFDIILKPQSAYLDITHDWSLDNKTNWLVYNENDQDHDHHIDPVHDHLHL
jgi:hypothetical protein